jgi:hypothetical protein
MVLLRRFLVVAALMFWQGGFTFYSSVVVPVGQEVLESHAEQARVTRHVALYLNLAGAIALALLAWDVAAGDPSAVRRRLRWGAWGVMVLALGLLVWLHPRLVELIDPESHWVTDATGFRPLHRLYLWTHTAQWAAGLVYALLMLQAWSAVDREEERKRAADDGP